MTSPDDAHQMRVVVGVGLSSAATAEEVRQLVADALEHYGLSWPPSALATRSRFARDPRLAWGVALGIDVIGIDDDDLVAASRPVERTVGLPARVAQTAAALAAGHNARPLGDVHRSAHATAAVAVTTAGR